MSPQRSVITLVARIVALVVAVLLLATACGSEDATDIAAGAGGDDPIPVEPDGGIGDGAEPLPGAEQPADQGTWHGAVVAETNCPGTTWKRVEASAFSFSVPTDFTETEVQPIDSEVGVWTNGAGIEVSYDYGWYSGSIAETPGAEVEAIDYSGFVGELAVVRAAEATGDPNMVGVHFGELVADDAGQWNKLGMLVTHAEPADEIIARCIVGSIDWKI